MGRPETATAVKPRGPMKSPISRGWIGMSRATLVGSGWSDSNQGWGLGCGLGMWLMANLWTVVLAFVLCGGLLFEVLRLFF